VTGGFQTAPARQKLEKSRRRDHTSAKRSPLRVPLPSVSSIC